MIQSSYDHGQTPTLAFDDGEVLAFVDRDWLPPPPGGPVPGFAVAADGSVRWNLAPLPTGDGAPRERFEGLVAAFLDDALAAISNVPRHAVRVTGRGVIASQLRHHIGEMSSKKPLAIIETIGTSAALSGACSEVADGGMVVLAGESLARVDLNLYRDVHRRGLQLIGVPGIASPRITSSERDWARHKTPMPDPAVALTGECLPAAHWYEVRSARSGDPR